MTEFLKKIANLFSIEETDTKIPGEYLIAVLKENGHNPSGSKEIKGSKRLEGFSKEERVAFIKKLLAEKGIKETVQLEAL
jgi:hypothetical protein